MKALKVDYIIAITSLSLLVALAWYYLFLMASHPSMDMEMMMNNKNPMTMSMDSMSDESMSMDSMSDESMSMDSMSEDMGSMSMAKINESKSTINFFMMPMTGDWGVSDFIVMFVMWTIMMFAMMLPSTFIFLNIFRMMRTSMQTTTSPFIEMIVISFTYFFIWVIFSLLACSLQYVLHNNGLVDMMGAIQSNIIAGVVLIGAGAFQFTELKNVCLEKCRNPLSFLMAGPINGYGNVALVGMKHGLFCLGCCWVLMLLLFVNGVMNLLWVIAITAIVLVEKMLPYEKLSSRFLGILLVGWGTYIIFI